MKHGRLDSVQQAIINPCESASFNLLTAVGNAGALNVMKVLMPADDAMDAVSNAVSSEKNPEKLAAIYEHLQAAADEAAHEAALLEEAAQVAEAASLSNSMPLAHNAPVPVPFSHRISATQVREQVPSTCLTCMTCSCRKILWKAFTLSRQIKSENCVSLETTSTSSCTCTCTAYSVHPGAGRKAVLNCPPRDTAQLKTLTSACRFLHTIDM